MPLYFKTPKLFTATEYLYHKSNPKPAVPRMLTTQKVVSDIWYEYGYSFVVTIISLLVFAVSDRMLKMGGSIPYDTLDSVRAASLVGTGIGIIYGVVASFCSYKTMLARNRYHALVRHAVETSGTYDDFVKKMQQHHQ